ncbi:Ig-like domain-containing protein [Hymenobacter aerophilus]|uniref:Ig-like domain-containing protein n=1 Tax=Hymenobacter aerophilus TaxID=119644 RepID=UPI0003A33C35|nr:Ig-like domain-containing protein [Hymenobacter aerophilus]
MDPLFPKYPVARWRGLLASLALLLLLLLPALSWAQAPSVGQVLNPDGTLRAGAKGSFSTDGYRMGQNPETGAPVFRPGGAGDEKWQDGFSLPGVNGQIFAVALDGSGNLYAGGNIRMAGNTPVNYVAKWNGTSWSALGTGLNDQVSALVVDGSGNLYAGGSFTTAGGGPANRVAKWNGTSWSALGTGVNDFVNAVATDGNGNVYAGGNFTTAGGVPANRVAKWNGTSWSALSTGLNASVAALAVDGSGTIYAGGFFTTAGGVEVNHVAKWNGTSWSALGAGLYNDVVALAVDRNGNLYAASGFFSSVPGTEDSNIAKWNGTSWSTLGTGTSEQVSALAVDGSGNLYAGGLFTTAGGVRVSHLAKWNGTSWSALGTGLNKFVYALAVDGSGNVYAGGAFSAAGGTTASYIAKWNGTSWSALGTGAGLNQSVITLAVDGNGNVYAGGLFTTAGGTVANRVAKWNGTSWSALGNGIMNNSVNALAVDDKGNVYAGGYFTVAGGSPGNYIAKWNGTSWSALGTGMNNSVLALSIDGSGNVYAAGQFTTAGGTAANRVAKWNGASWSALGTGLNNFASALALDGSGSLYAGGTFTSAGGTTANYIAKWNGTSWSALGTGLNLSARTLAFDSNGSLYAGGNFTTAGDVPANYVAKWNGTSWSALGTGLDKAAEDMAVDGSGNVYVGGSFSTAGGAPANYVAKWNGTSWSALGTGLNNFVSAVALKGNDVYVGGSFTATGDGSKTMASFGIYHQSGPTVIISSAASSPTSTSPIPVTVTFSESVTGFVAGDVTISNGVLAGFAGSGPTYTFNVTPATAGTVTVNVAANAAQDQAGNGNTAAPQFSIQYAAPAAQDLTINGGMAPAPTNIPAGTYNTITITGTGFAQLGGPVVVNGAFTVQNGGGLSTNSQVLTGSGSFTLASGGTLVINDPAGITASGSTGAVQVKGLRSFAADASYAYNGSQAQVTGSGLPAQVRNLSTSNNSPLTLSAPVGVRQVLTLAGAGNLNLNGQALTLRSDASGTALVVNSGSGAVTGMATMQRYIDPSLNAGLGYRHYSSPVQATTVGDLATAGFAPVVNPAYNTAADPGSVTPFPTVYGYDEARLTGASATSQAFEFGYFSPAALSNALVPGRGYTVNLAASQTVDLNGTLSTGTVPMGALSRGPQASAGWQLLGNPYPAPLDWSQARNGLPTGVIDAVYVYKSGSQYAGTYQFYQNGFGTLPGGLIPAMQGFFLRVSQNVPSFSFQNAWRVTSYQSPTFNRPTADTRPAVQLDLVDAKGSREPTYVYFEADATPGRDDHYDAEKLPNTTGLNLASVAATGEALAVNGLPALSSEVVTVPLIVDLPQTGRFALTAASLANLPATTLVELVDNQTGTRHDLRQLPAGGYGFSADSRHVAGRFALNLRPNAVLATGSAALADQVRAYPNPSRDQLTISRPAGGPASAVLLNAVGQQLRTVALPTTETRLSLLGLPTGVYALRVTLAGGQTVVQRVVVQQ